MSRRWTPLLAVATLLVAGAFAAALSSPELTRLPLPEAVPTGEAAPATPDAVPASPDASGFQLPGWLAVVAAGLCLAAVAFAVGFLVWIFLKDRIRVRSKPLTAVDQPSALRTEEVVAAVDAGLSGLSDSDADPRRAVIACWVRLEEAAATAGTPRHPGDTPTDLVARLLAAHRVSQPVLDALAAVYREARYATHPVDESMRAAAIRSLGQLRAELTARVEVG
jgi:hypothetical protein